MIKEKGKTFNSKILLFGEYSLLKGSMALSIPYDRFWGQLQKDQSLKNGKSEHFSVQYLEDYLQFLDDNNLGNILKINEFREDINNGLFFECNIPVSYGLGSSGAIVASIFNAYSLNTNINNLTELISTFSRMEAYYHGSSSGLDPLTSYFNSPVLFKKDSLIETVELPLLNNEGNGVVFLLDTKTHGETQPLVRWFLDAFDKNIIRNEVLNELIPLNNKIIVGLLKGSINDIMSEIKQLSTFTYENLNKMIPDDIKGIWHKGIESGDFYLKLCGSGGGGMMLGFAKNADCLKTHFSGYDIHPIFRI